MKAHEVSLFQLPILVYQSVAIFMALHRCSKKHEVDKDVQYHCLRLPYHLHPHFPQPSTESIGFDPPVSVHPLHLLQARQSLRQTSNRLVSNPSALAIHFVCAVS